MTVWFTADTHFGHANIIRYCGRPFETKEEHDQVLIDNPTDLVLVVGDVTSTMACSIVAKKLNIKVAHVEAGIRSFDLTMPEEINRMVTDSITDYFCITSQIQSTPAIHLNIANMAATSY